MHYEEYRQRRVFGSLDGIRAGSILAVIWHHATPRGGYNLPMFDRGFLGVDMFFVLSGFLIVTLLLRERDRNGSISLRNFYARRTLRIFPVYYALLGVLTALYLLKPDAGSASAFFAELPYQVSYTSNWVETSVLAFTWSLATEEQFYLLWPPIERFIQPLAIPFLLVVIGISQVVNFGVLDSPLHDLFGESSEVLHILQVTFTPICLGVLVAHILHHQRGFTCLAKIFGARFQPILGSALVLLACNLPGDDISGWIRLFVHITMTYLLISLVVREDHLLQRALNFSIIKRMGAISYGMYLFHVFAVTAVLKMMDRFSLSNAILSFVFTTLLTFLISEVSFRFFESPIMRWKKRFNS